MKDLEDTAGRALKYAFKLLGYRDRSRKEMFDKLALKGFSKNTAEETVAFLKERGFIDDNRLAAILKKDAVERRHLGKKGLRSFLLKRGIAREVIDAISVDEDEYIYSAKRLAEKKLKHLKNYNEETVKRKLWGMLERRGYSSDNIKTVMKFFNLKEDSQ